MGIQSNPMSEEILSYIPQRAPFVMIGNVISADAQHTRTTLHLTDENIFVQGGQFTEPGLIENIAQTAGAGTGYMAIASGKPTPMGYIAALKNIVIEELPLVNETITTDIVFESVMRNFHQVKGTVTVNDRIIARCEMKIFVSTDKEKMA